MLCIRARHRDPGAMSSGVASQATIRKLKHDTNTLYEKLVSAGSSSPSILAHIGILLIPCCVGRCRGTCLAQKAFVIVISWSSPRPSPSYQAPHPAPFCHDGRRESVSDVVCTKTRFHGHFKCHSQCLRYFLASRWCLIFSPPSQKD